MSCALMQRDWPRKPGSRSSSSDVMMPFEKKRVSKQSLPNGVPTQGWSMSSRPWRRVPPSVPGTTKPNSKPN